MESLQHQTSDRRHRWRQRLHRHHSPSPSQTRHPLFGTPIPVNAQTNHRRTAALHHNHTFFISELLSTLWWSCSSKTRVVLCRIVYPWECFFHLGFACMSWILTRLASVLSDFGFKLWSRLTRVIDGFFYGFEHSMHHNHRDGNNSRGLRLINGDGEDDDDDAMDPLTDIIRCSPYHAAWFIKTAMLFGAVSGILLTLPVALYLKRYWAPCSNCPKPFRWWLLSNCCLQLLQLPLRMCFVQCINGLLRSAGRPTGFQSSVSPQLQNEDSDDVRITESDDGLRNVPNPILSQRFPNRRISTRATRIVNSNGSPSRELSFSRQPDRPREVARLSKRLVALTHSYAWRLSVWLSIVAYAWFLVGVVWICSTHGDTSCCGSKNNNNVAAVILGDKYKYNGISVKPDIRVLTIVVLTLSMSRLGVVAVLFFLALPSRLFSDHPHPRRVVHRNTRTSDAAALRRLRDAFASLDYQQSIFTNYVGRNQTPEQQQQRAIIISSDESDREFMNIDHELMSRTSSETDSLNDDIISLTSDDDEDATVINDGLRLRRRRQRVEAAQQQPRQRQRRCNGLPKSVINQLPIMFYSQFVFPRTLKSKNSLDTVKTRWNERRRIMAKTSCKEKESTTWDESLTEDENQKNRSASSISTSFTSSRTSRVNVACPNNMCPNNNHVLSPSPSSRWPQFLSSSGIPSQQPSRATQQPSSRIRLFRSNKLTNSRNSEEYNNDGGDSGLGSCPSPNRGVSQICCSKHFPSIPSSDKSSRPLLSTWRRLRLCLASVISNRATHTEFSSTVQPDLFDFTEELFAGPPLFLASCSICLEDFEENSEIRQLPCRHGFHRVCIDTWLTQAGSCPLCHEPIFHSNLIFP